MPNSKLLTMVNSVPERLVTSSILVAVLYLVSTCSCSPCTRFGIFEVDDNNPSLPFLAITRGSFSLVDYNGLVVAVWRDGRVVRASSTTGADVSCVDGTISQSDVQRIIASIQEKSLQCAEPPDQLQFLDAPFFAFHLRLIDGIHARIEDDVSINTYPEPIRQLIEEVLSMPLRDPNPSPVCTQSNLEHAWLFD